jgi:hypothetical protein
MTKFRLLLLVAVVAVSLPSTTFGQLTGITPNSSNFGQTLTTTITSNGLFVQGISPNGNIYEIFLQNGTSFISIYDPWAFNWGQIQVIDANTVNAEFSIPHNAAPGVYDLHLTTSDPSMPWLPMPYQYFSLPGAFTVNPPDGYISGNVYRDDNRNGSKDSGEPNLQNEYVRIFPANRTYPTDASGNYNIPVYNGNHWIAYNRNTNDIKYNTTGIDTIYVAINNNNSSGNNFGINGALLSINPSILVKGDTSVHTITANKPIFRTGTTPNGNVTQAIIYTNPQITISYLTNVTVIDSFTVQVTIPVPANTAAGTNIDLRLYTHSSIFGFHFLRQQLSVVSPPACASPDSTWASFITASSFRTNWTPVQGAHRYQIFYKVGGTPTWIQRSVAGTKTYMGIQNLNCGTTYRWKVRTVCQTPTGTIRSVWTPVKITNTLSCEANSGDKILSVEDAGIEIYPNPANDQIMIDPGFEISSSTSIEVYNLAGKMMLSRTIDEPNEYGSFELDVSSLHSGMYFIRVNGMTSKFIVQRD